MPSVHDATRRWLDGIQHHRMRLSAIFEASGVIGLFASEKAELIAPLPRAACVKRLQVELDSPLQMSRDRPVVG
jgi:hypothetical protein